jgi:hypothetical protein
MTETKKKTPGPKPERVKSDRNWIDAIRDALKKERPEEGWPDPEKEKPPRSDRD